MTSSICLRFVALTFWASLGQANHDEATGDSMALSAADQYSMFVDGLSLLGQQGGKVDPFAVVLEQRSLRLQAGEKVTVQIADSLEGVQCKGAEIHEEESPFADDCPVPSIALIRGTTAAELDLVQMAVEIIENKMNFEAGGGCIAARTRKKCGHAGRKTNLRAVDQSNTGELLQNRNVDRLCQTKTLHGLLKKLSQKRHRSRIDPLIDSCPLMRTPRSRQLWPMLDRVISLRSRL